MTSGLAGFRESRTVHWGDCAPSGAVFYPTYFRWFDEGTWNLFASLGLPIDKLAARYGVVGLPLQTNDCSYRRPCRLGDVLTLISAVTEVGLSDVFVEHRVENAGHIAVVSREHRFWGQRHVEDPIRLRRGNIPEEVKSILSRAAQARSGDVRSVEHGR